MIEGGALHLMELGSIGNITSVWYGRINDSRLSIPLCVSIDIYRIAQMGRSEPFISGYINRITPIERMQKTLCHDAY